jgi:hypothetical protein
MGARNIDFLHTHGVEFIYHMTHIDNVPGILKQGLQAHGNTFQKRDISNHDVNSRRSRREPVYGKRIHDYVPFYFSPRNPMLFVQDNRDEIVILVFKASLLYEEGMLFTDGNASVGNTRFYDDLADLDNLNWNCINSSYWPDFRDGKREKMAEVLIPRNVNKSKIVAMLCNNKHTQRKVNQLTQQTINCLIAKNFYF